MNELDLHGFYHHQVPLEVDNFVNLNYNNFPVRIIVGRSEMMRNIVETTLKSSNLEYEIPAHNSGEIIVRK